MTKLHSSAQSPRMNSGIYFICGLGLILGWRWIGDFSGAMGSDAALWGLSARDLGAGLSSHIPPGYPALIAFLHELGLPLVLAGWLISSLALAGVSAVVFMLARALGARPFPAGIAAIISLIHPDLFEFAHQVQPDALSALLITLIALLCLRSDQTLWAAILGGLLLLFREHGIALWPALVILFGHRNGTRSSRILPVVILVAVAWLGPLLVGQSPGVHPLDTPWAERTGGALQAFQVSDPSELSYLHELNREDRQAYSRLVLTDDRWGQLTWHARRSLTQAWELWCALGLALLLAIGAARRGQREPLWTALLLTGALPALVIWSQSRHVALLLPVALAIGSASWPESRNAKRIMGIAAMALLWPWPGRFQDLHEGQRGETLRGQNLAEIGTWICEQAPEGAFLGGFIQDIGLYCPLRRHDPNGTLTDWKTYLVTDRSPPASDLGTWEEVYGEGGPLQVYQLDPERDPRPCAQGIIDPHTPFLAIAQAKGKLICP